MFCTKEKVQKRVVKKGTNLKVALLSAIEVSAIEGLFLKALVRWPTGVAGKVRQKYFLDVLTHPLTLNFNHFSPSVGASKHPKILLPHVFWWLVFILRVRS